jgi:hypothetical protein
MLVLVGVDGDTVALTPWNENVKPFSPWPWMLFPPPNHSVT